MAITRKLFGMEGDREVSLYTLTNKNGVEAQITDYAGAIVSLKVPDREGRFTDVVCGFDGIEEYKTAPGGHGALIGRFATGSPRAASLLRARNISFISTTEKIRFMAVRLDFHISSGIQSPSTATSPSFVLHLFLPIWTRISPVS